MHYEVQRASRACGGVHCVLIDGIADLVADVSLSTDTDQLVGDLVSMASEHACPIIMTLHENPGDLTGKTRGHLGSQLERKAESNLRLVKDTEGVSAIIGKKYRRAHIPKSLAPRFTWSREMGRHVSRTPKAINALTLLNVSVQPTALADLVINLKSLNYDVYGFKPQQRGERGAFGFSSRPVG